MARSTGGMRGRLRRDRRVVLASLALVVLAALGMLVSYRYSRALLLGIAVCYVAYRLVAWAFRRFRGEHPVRLLLMAALAIAVALSLTGAGEQPFAIVLLLAFDYMMVQRLMAAARSRE